MRISLFSNRNVLNDREMSCQVYSDGVRAQGGPLQDWATEFSPRKRAHTPLTKKLKSDLDEW